jgi:Fe-S cluster assembly ATP-binding protein
MTKELTIRDLRVERDGNAVVRGVSLSVPAGGAVALLGPNGSGKTSLVSALMGHPGFKVTGGAAALDGVDLLGLGPDERARRGLFLSMQQPPEVPGVTVGSFLRAAFGAVSDEQVGMAEFRERLVARMRELGMNPDFLGRGLGEGFSGGEKKRLEMLQLAVLRPKYALLDETDSGLDVDALGLVADGVERARAAGTGILIITHNPQVLARLNPGAVHVLCQGVIRASGGMDLAERIAERGYCAAGCAEADEDGGSAA